MSRYYLRALLAHLRAGPALYGLTLLGIALGVAAVASIQIINRSAIAAFQATVAAVSGDADLTVVGRTPTFAEALYPVVLAERGVEAAWPVSRLDVAVAGRQGLFLEVIGVDLVAPRGLPWRDARPDLATALTRPGWIAVSPTLTREQGWRPGDPVEVTSGTRRVRLEVGALVDWGRRHPRASRRLVVMDLAQVQHLFGRPGVLTQIDVRASAGVDRDDLAARLAARLGPAVEVVTPERRTAEAEGLLGAFRLNLTALSLVSLFVGVFLVHASTHAALVRRRQEFGVLRALGATRGQVLGLILAEVALVGLGGVLLGLPLAYWAAAANLDVVSATLENLYLLEAIETLALPGWIAGLAGLIGIGGALAGALLPAVDVIRTHPRALLAAFLVHERAETAARPLGLAGAAVLVAALLWFAGLGSGWRPAGFVLALALLAAIPLVTPFVVQRTLGRVRLRGFGLAYSLRGLATRLETTTFAVAGLAVAVSMLVGITLMIGSFRRTVEAWVADTLRADVYVTTESWARAREAAPLDDALAAELAGHPGVRSVDRLRQFFGRSGDRRVSIAGVDAGIPGGEARFALFAGDPPEALRRVRDEGAVLVSEPLARKAGLTVGDRVPLWGPAGALWFPVAGIFHDYRTESGAVVMDLRTMAARFGPGPIGSLALYLEPGRDPEQVADELRARHGAAPLQVRSHGRLRREVLAIFDQTFAVTRLLEGMSLVIAAGGIALALLVLARERVAELALCRALGARRAQLFGIFVGKGLGMAVLALALGLAGGAALAALLVFVINRAYFGWTIQVHWPWAAVAHEIATILAAALVASLYPALRASRAPATELARDDL